MFYSLTLLEMMIGLFLLGAILSALTTAFYRISKSEAKVSILKEQALQRQKLQLRLTPIFSSLYEEGDEMLKKDSFIPLQIKSFSQFLGPALVFTYNNGVDPIPSFCGQVIGMISLNTRHELCLFTWPSEQENQTQMRKEVLLEKAKSLSFRFFNREKKNWEETWEKEVDLPAFFKIQIEKQKRSFEWIFFPNGDPEGIIFEEKQ